MEEEREVVTLDGPWLGSPDLLADFGDKEVAVTLDENANRHLSVAGPPGQRAWAFGAVTYEALPRASAAATIATGRGSPDAHGRILVAAEDLDA